MAAATTGDHGPRRAVITLADSVAEPTARRGEQETAMADRDLDRVLQFLLSAGYVGADRRWVDHCSEWRYLRLLPTGLVAIGAWPPPAGRARLPTGCTTWDGRDAPVLARVGARDVLPVVACTPADGSPGSREGLFAGLPVTRVDGYWSLLALRDAGLVGGTDHGADGWRDVSATAAGRELAQRLG